MRFVLACVLVAVIASSGRSVAQDNSDAQAKAEADSPQRFIRQYSEHMGARRFNEAIEDINRIKLDDDNREGQALLNAMRATALFGLKRDPEARSLVAKADALAPRFSAPVGTLFYGGVFAGRFDVSADALDKMLARFPDAVRDIDSESMSLFLRNEPSGAERRNEDRRIELARIGYGGELDGDYFVSEAVDILVKRGDRGTASDLLRYIDVPPMIENLLIQKRYSTLWPRVAEIAGPHLAKVRASSVAAAERAYAEKPDDHDVLQSYINALRRAGRLDEAIALRSKLPATAEAMATTDERMGWAINHVALSLHERGRSEDADQLFALLNEAPAQDLRWRVSMIINRLELLVTAGKFERALQLLEATERSARNDGSPYARQLVRRLRYCTLSGLGRIAERAKVRPELIAHAADAYHATVDAFLCSGEMDEAEKIALAALADSDSKKRASFEEHFIRALQPVPLTSDDPSKWQDQWAQLRRRRGVAEKFHALGRDMPVEFLPLKPTTTATK